MGPRCCAVGWELRSWVVSAGDWGIMRLLVRPATGAPGQGFRTERGWQGQWAVMLGGILSAEGEEGGGKQTGTNNEKHILERGRATERQPVRS